MTRFMISTRKYAYILLFMSLLIGFPVHLLAECKVTLNWKSHGLIPEGYRLYERKANSDADWDTFYDVGNETSCTVDGLEEKATYHFVVRSYLGADESADSNEATFECTGGPKTNEPNSSSSTDPNSPSKPRLISPEDADQKVSLEPMLASSEYYDPDPGDIHAKTRWRIFRLENDECIFDVTSSKELTALKVPSDTLEPFTPYYWTVTYYSISGGQSEDAPARDFTTTDEIKVTSDLYAAPASQTGTTSRSANGGIGLDGGISEGLFGVGCFIESLLGTTTR